MLKRNITKIISTILIISLLGGCSKEVQYENASYMTDLTYKTQFDDEMKLKARTIKKVESNMIELHDVSEETSNTITELVLQDIKDLNKVLGYSNDYYIHENFKFLLDNRVQKGLMKTRVLTNNKYYYAFVSMETDKKNYVNEFRKAASYLGIRGAIGYNENDEEAVDEVYLKLLIDEINKRRQKENKDEVDTEIEQIDYLSDFHVEELFDDKDYMSLIGTASETVLEDISEEYEDLNSKEDIFKEIQDDEAIEEASLDNFGRKTRTLIYDAKEFNSLLGMVSNAEFVIPNINALFKIESEKTVGGYSLYDWGSTIEELKEEPTKAYEMVFIYKYNIDEEEFELKNLFPFRIYTGPIQTDIEKNLLLKAEDVLDLKKDNYVETDFLQKQLEIKIEEINRALLDKSFTSFTSQDLIIPQDLGLYLLNYRNSISLIDSSMYLKSIESKESNTYLCRVEQVSVENVKGIEGTGGRYYREWLMRFRLKGSKIYLDDMYLNNLYCLRAPELVPDKGVYLKIYSNQYLDLTVPDNVKSEIQEVNKELEIALTNKTDEDLRDDQGNIKYFQWANYKGTTYKKECAETDEGAIPAYGVKSKITEDTTVLTARDREKYIQDFMDRLKKYDQSATVYIQVGNKDWLASANTGDLVIIKATFYYIFNNTIEIPTYYITYSKYRDYWRIDEMSLDDTEYISGDDVQIVREQLEKSRKEVNNG